MEFMNGKRKVKMQIKYAEQQLRKWQKRLGLSDWEIIIRYSDTHEMDGGPAKTKINDELQHADIRLLLPEDRQKNEPADKDIELDIIHELIHVRLWAIDPRTNDSLLHICREQAVEWIAKALITTARTEKEIK
jgi:hypothetical protein